MRVISSENLEVGKIYRLMLRKNQTVGLSHALIKVISLDGDFAYVEYLPIPGTIYQKTFLEIPRNEWTFAEPAQDYIESIFPEECWGEEFLDA